jgi:hypothetical protein
MRKAGGTTMRVFLKSVAKAHNLTLRVSEGRPDTTTVDWGRTFRITNLREPIQRAISHYKYDQRWSCKKSDTDSLMRRGFVPSESNERMAFEEFLRIGDRNQDNARHPEMLWTCATNCFARWATGQAAYVDAVSDKEAAKMLLDGAYNALCQYDLIVNTDWLGDEAYREAVQKYFGVDSKIASKNVYCAKNHMQPTQMCRL